MSDAVRALLSELLDLAERDDEICARLRALVAEPEQGTATADGPRYLSVAEIVARSPLSETTVRRAITAGELPSSKRGGRRLVSLADFEQWAGSETKTRPDRRTRRGAGASYASLVRSRDR